MRYFDLHVHAPCNYLLSFKAVTKRKFVYCGCGWKAIDTKTWSDETNGWIENVADLFEQIFGGDF